MASQAPTPTDPASNAPPMTDEADIGSGEKTPAQRETEEQIRAISPRPPAPQPPKPSSPAKP